MELTLLCLIPYLFLSSGAADGLLIALCSIARQDDLGGPLLMRVAATAITGLILFQTIRIIWALWATIKTSQSRGLRRTLLIPCRVSHSRIFPKQHSFSGRYLVVGILVDFEGNGNRMVSVGMGRKSGLSSSWRTWLSFAFGVPKGWFHVDPDDYLIRSNADLDLRGKLDEFLRNQGVNPADYPYAYLVTAPRFWGYQFNPVSFWYLYDADKCLVAMIVEVNNNFDERQAYYILLANDAERHISDSGEQHQDRQTIYTQSWLKDFHVSPFNSRKGSYKLTTSNPLGPAMEDMGQLSIALDLISSKGHLKLGSTMNSQGPPIDPYKMTTLDKLMFLASWWWVGLVTVPRIIKEAAVLFYCHELHVWWRPEPLKGTISRRANSIEQQLESVFRGYLRHLVDLSPASLTVKYIASGLQQNVMEVMLSSAAREALTGTEEVEIRILTPRFYSRFVYYAHDLEAFFCELHESRTIWVSRPDLLPKILLKKPTTKLESANLTQYACFKMIQHLRVRPERIERPMTSSTAKTATVNSNAVDIRNFYISSMDAYVMADEARSVQSAYRNCVLKLFLADRIALGSVRFLAMQRTILQVCLAWLLSSAMTDAARSLSASFGDRLSG